MSGQTIIEMRIGGFGGWGDLEDVENQLGDKCSGKN
jgi:hypothetical protein